MMAAGLAWMALFVGLGNLDNPSLNAIAEWLSPMGVAGWAFFLVLSVVCSWLIYLLLRPRAVSVERTDTAPLPNHVRPRIDHDSKV